MAIKIIKRGTPINPDKLYLSTCEKCNSVIQYSDLDVKQTIDKDIYIDCPVCNVKIWTQVKDLINK